MREDRARRRDGGSAALDRHADSDGRRQRNRNRAPARGRPAGRSRRSNRPVVVDGRLRRRRRGRRRAVAAAPPYAVRRDKGVQRPARAGLRVSLRARRRLAARERGVGPGRRGRPARCRTSSTLRSSVGGCGSTRAPITRCQPVHVEDVARAVRRRAGRTGSRSAGSTTSRAASGSRSGTSPRWCATGFPAQTSSSAPDDLLGDLDHQGPVAITAADRELGYRPRWGLARGIDDYCAWRESSDLAEGAA